ncbi:MAG: MFS transporter [Oscillospiraceae bacterium]|nr:MFS transporter [Oscillospiraceae bacterium]
MQKQGISSAAKKAILIGGMCSLSYLAVYVARNILGAVSPQMIEKGDFTTEQIGTLSSIYFITYAVGQLINGAIGDRIKAKYMISLGLAFAGVCNVLVSILSTSPLLAYISYGMTGFFLSMIYGPMSKLVAENTEPIYTTRCSLGYTFASFFGSPSAGLLASWLVWQDVFSISSILLLVMGGICFIVFTLFERKGLIKYGQYAPPKEKSGSIRLLIKHRIIRFTFISIITGIIRTTVVFWLPTYLSQYLSFSSETSAQIFTVATFIISMSTFISIFLYERLKRNMDLTILISFSVSAGSFLIVCFLKQPVLNIVFMVLAILASNCAATMLWSRYCPGLRDTGMVSSATGFLDCMSYLAAAVSSTLFANAVSVIGWSWLIIVWFGLAASGILVSLPCPKLWRRKSAE